MSTITQISPDKFSIQDYTFEDYDIVPNFEVTSIFQPSESVVEYFIYDANSNLLAENYNFPGYSFTQDPSITNLGGFSTMDITPELDLINTGYDVGQYNVVYNFFENQLNSNNETTFYISEISTDRTEIKLASNVIQGALEAFPAFKEILESEDYFNEFYLNFGDNQIIIAINAVIYEGSILIKLYDPLPPIFNTKSTCWVTLKIADPVAYNVNLITPDDATVEDSVPFLKGPNTNLQIKSEVNNSTKLGSIDDILATTLTSSFQQVSSLLNENGISINIDYTDYSNYIQFSSAEQRLLNFYTKVSQIEDNTNDLINFDFNITGSSSASFYVSESKAASQQQIDRIIRNFDDYEYFLYFESSSHAWPKQNTEPPFILYSTGSTEVLNWIGNSVEGTTIPNNVFPYGPYGGLALSASMYDAENPSNLLYSMPEYILNDSQNEPYQLFIEMLGQHFDNIWIYLKDVTNKYDADNRLNFGISKDLVAQAIRDFGLKIYQNQFSTDDLYSAFLGLTPSGSLLPYTGSELITSYVTASSAVTPLDDVNKSIYKRLYHNLPYLLKKKGTIQGVKGLIASYGIPNTILRVNEFGGKDRDNSNDWDYWYNKFNYGFYTSGSNFVSSDFTLNPTWGATDNRPGAVEFRFKSDGVPTEHFTQSLWSTNNGIALNLEYENSGLTSGSYSGSVVSTYKDYGYLRLYPDPTDLTVSASVYLPIFDNGWWSVLINSGSTGYDLYTKNKIYIGDDASYIGFQASSSIQEVNTLWAGATTSTFASGSNEYFSGSLQEIRYYKPSLSESVFNDYVQNPLSSEGNTLNSSPLDLAFRASLGAELNSGSLESVHPKITGSWIVTQSFASDSVFAYNTTPIFVPNTEYIFLDQPAAGIKNRITDKVRIGEQILPEGSNQVLSKYRSIEQQLPLSQSFTPDVNSIEAAFSPQNEINDDIIEQIGYFNLGEKIGDNRYNFYTRSTNSNFAEFTRNEEVPYRTDYQDLTQFSREYFEKYTSNYDVFDYVRLIKFFDNSLFKMIKDFVPAKSSLSSGVVIKQHLLERSRYPHPKVNPTTKIARVQGTGSADDTMVDYNVKDLALSGSVSIGSIKGGAGGGPNVYNQIANNPYEQSIGTELPFGTPVTNLTQSFTQSLDTVAGVFETIDFKQEEFYNGEYSGSEYIVTDGELSSDCFVYLHGLPDSVNFSASMFNASSSFVTADRFVDSYTTPMINGYAYFFGTGSTSTPGTYSQVRVSKFNAEGNNLGNAVASLTAVTTISELESTRYNFLGNPADLGTDYLYNIGSTSPSGDRPPTYTNNNIIDISFDSAWYDTTNVQEFAIWAGSSGGTLAPTQSFEINSGKYKTNNPLFPQVFFPLSILNIIGSTPDNVIVTKKNPNFVSESVFQPNGEMIYHYSNDSLLQVQAKPIPGRTSDDCNIKVSDFSNLNNIRTVDTSADVQFCMVQEKYGGSGFPEYKVVWEGNDGNFSPLTSAREHLFQIAPPSQSFFPTQGTDESEFLATDQSGIETRYFLGFMVKSLYPNPSWNNPSNPFDPPLSLVGAISSSSDYASFSQPTSVTGSTPIYFSIIQSGSDDQGNKLPLPTILEQSNPGNFRNSDCDILQGNAIINRPGTLYYDVDYESSQQDPSNQEAILNNSAQFANVQNSNYTTLSQINPRYKGSRTTSEAFNVWNSASVNTFGKLPTVSREKTYFAYCDNFNGTSPELNNKSIAHIQFLVDQDGNTIPPDETKLYLTQNSFQTGETVFVNLEDPTLFEAPMNELNGSQTVIRGGSRVDTLLYTDSGSSYSGADMGPGGESGSIQFNTGSISVTNYQFGATRDISLIVNNGDNQVYNWDTTTSPNTGQWDLSTDKFTFSSNTDSPVKFEFNGVTFFSGYGNFQVYLLLNYSGTGPFNDILDSFSGVYGGSSTTDFINLDSGFRNFSSGDTVQVWYQASFGGTFMMNYNLNDTFTSTNQINPDGVVDPVYWTTGSNWDRLWLTGSAGLSEVYGSRQFQSWEQSNVNGTNDPRPEFDPIIQDFTVQVGDEIRFNGVEAYSRMISAVKFPSQESDGLLKILLNDSMSTAANQDHFLLRRYVDDASYVLIDSDKPEGSTSPGTMRSEFVTDKLEDNFPEAVSIIQKSNAGS